MSFAIARRGITKWRRLVIYINPSHNILYSRPGLAIFLLATILKPSHVWGEQGYTYGVSAGLPRLVDYSNALTIHVREKRRPEVDSTSS